MRRRWVTRARRPLSLLFAGWLCALLLETAPHLVHHLFDEDQGSDCEFLAAADAPVVIGAPAEIVVERAPSDLPADGTVPQRPSGVRMAAVARAPPFGGQPPG